MGGYPQKSQSMSKLSTERFCTSKHWTLAPVESSCALLRPLHRPQTHHETPGWSFRVRLHQNPSLQSHEKSRKFLKSSLKKKKTQTISQFSGGFRDPYGESMGNREGESMGAPFSHQSRHGSTCASPRLRVEALWYGGRASSSVAGDLRWSSDRLLITHDGSVGMPYMVTFTINIPPMLAYVSIYTIHGSYG